MLATIETDPGADLWRSSPPHARDYDLDGWFDRIPDLEGLTPTLTRVDGAVDFAEDVAFALPFAPDTFAVRWRGDFVADVAGEHTFIVGSDDGTRLTIAGQRLLEDSGLHGYTERAATVWLPAGPSPLELEYFEDLGAASARLFHAPPGGQRAVLSRLALRPDAR